MQPNSVVVFKPDKPVAFSVGANILLENVETKTTIEKITVLPLFRYAKIHLSNGNKIVFSGLPFSAEYGKNSFV